MIRKERPIATVEYDYGNDGRDGHYYVAYKCPNCLRRIPWYKYETACDRCGTFYNWGKNEPRIEIKRSIRWD